MHVIRERIVAGSHLSECVVPGGMTSPEHTHDHAWLTLVLSGSCEEVYRGTRTVYTALSSTFHYPGERHVVRTFDEGVRSFGIRFDSEWLSQLPAYIPPRDIGHDGTRGSLTWLAARAYREFRNDDTVSGTAIEGLLLEMTAVLSRAACPPKSGDPPTWLARVDDLVQTSYHEPISLSRLADDVDIHPAHLARVFKRHYGITVGEYIRVVRVDHACQEILTTSAPIGQIAIDVGFKDHGHFTRTFKRVTGMVPSECRREYHRSNGHGSIIQSA